jgi:hypothetical protein
MVNIDMGLEYRLYVTINKINGKVYGGKHYYRSNKKRCREYMGSGYALISAFEKYGKENFERRWFKIKITSKERLDKLEIKLIRRLHHKFGKDNCYNIHRGGTGGGYTHYMSTEEIKEVNKKVSDGLKEMYKDPVKKANWKASLEKRKETIKTRTNSLGKTRKEIEKIKYIKTNGRSLITYKIIYPNGLEVIESKCLKHFMNQYKTDDFILLKARRNGSYVFNKVTKLSKHSFPKGTEIHHISEFRTFDNYKNEEPEGSSVPSGSVNS